MDEVVQVKEFLSHEECDYLIDGIKRAGSTTSSANTFFDEMMIYPDGIRDIGVLKKMDEATNQLIEIVAHEFKVGRHGLGGGPIQGWHGLYKDTMLFGKWTKGKSMPPHRDNQDLAGQEDISTPWRDYTCVVYLNDDYEGGEFVLPEADIEIKPEKGEAVLLRAGELHGVEEITDGTRYTLITWLTHDVRKVMPHRKSLERHLKRLEAEQK